jgi:tetratricopeptide (TPR) repeat protein
MATATELKEQGLKHYRAERFDEAAAAFAQAAQLLEAAGNVGDAAEMRNNVCVVRMAQEKWAEALTAVQGTPEIFRQLNDKLREAQAVANLAAAQEGLGNIQEAVDFYLQAIDLFGPLGEKETRSACYKKLSGLQVKLGKQFEALHSMRSGLNLSSELTAKEKMLKDTIDKAMKMMGMP